MSTMTLPPVTPAPIPTALVPPPSPGTGNAANAAGLGSFSQLLEAADARRQAEAPTPAASPSPPAMKSAAPRADSKTQNTAGARPPPPTQKTGPRDDTRTGRAEEETDADNNTAVRDEIGAVAGVPEEMPICTDAASLLASLGLVDRSKSAPLPGETGAARTRAGGGRQMLEALADGSTGRSGNPLVGPATGGACIAPGDLKISDAGDHAAAGKAFTGLLAAGQGADAAAFNAAGSAASFTSVMPEAALAPIDGLAPDATALGSLALQGVAPGAVSAGSSAAHPAEARLGTPPGQPGFAEQLGAQLSTFVREGVQHARLQLHPLELGPVTVQIQLDGGSAHMSFAAEHAQTRLALEQALPTLAGSLREAGLTLSGGGVFEQPQQPQQDGSGGRNDGRTDGSTRSGRGDGAGNGDGSADSNDAARQLAPAQRRRGVVDLVA